MEETPTVSSTSPSFYFLFFLERREPGRERPEFIIRAGELLDVLLVVLLYFLQEPFLHPTGVVLQANSREVWRLLAFGGFAITLNALRFDGVTLIAFVFQENVFARGIAKRSSRGEAEGYKCQ